jgi:hypothetical protein
MSITHVAVVSCVFDPLDKKTSYLVPRKALNVIEFGVCRLDL